MRYLLKVIWTLVGFGVGIIVSLVGVELVRYVFAEMYGNYYRPLRTFPPGILLGGIVSGIAGWRTAPTPDAFRFSGALGSFSQPMRYWVAGAVCWVLLLLILVWGIDLFGSYWSDREWRKFWVIMLGPPLLGIVAIPLVRWARNGHERQK
jgi:hypothetical protein